ncbi:MAG: hypothetical protein E3J78_07320 [Candidatus Cloacimonadota bacterium]|nr:MAG: hypothetical protein E3J78_07320 [Candidatus Cloacimonadota bacterium]
MDDIIEKLKKRKGKKSKSASPLDDFFSKEEETENDASAKASENGLDIKPFGRTMHGQDKTETAPEVLPDDQEHFVGKEHELAKGIRELTFDEIDDAEEADTPKQKETKNTTVEIHIGDQTKLKHIKLIVALLEAGQFEVAHQEIDRMKAL